MVLKRDLRKLKRFQMRCLRDILGVTLWDRMQKTTILEKTGELAVVYEKAPVVWACLEDANPSSPETTCAVQTEWKEETSRWSTSAVV